MNKLRVEKCANLLQETLEIEADEFPGVEGDYMEEMAEETALAVGYTQAEIAAAWLWINEQEGA